MNYYEQISVDTPIQNNRTGRKALILALILLMLAAGGGLIYRYAIIGWATTDVTVSSVSVAENHIQLTGELNGFAGLRSFDCHTDEDSAVISLIAVWPLFGVEKHFSITLDGDFSGVSEIDLTDGNGLLVIWNADSPAQLIPAGK